MFVNGHMIMLILLHIHIVPFPSGHVIINIWVPQLQGTWYNIRGALSLILRSHDHCYFGHTLLIFESYIVQLLIFVSRDH